MPERGSLDWDDARRRLERASRRLQHVTPSPAEVERRLRERARQLARPPVQPEDGETTALELLEFACGSGRYAVPVLQAEALARLGELTLLPHLPSYWAGLILHRGVVLPVLDVNDLAGAGVRQAGAAGFALAVRVGDLSFGLLADTVHGFLSVSEAALVRARQDRARPGFVRGITPRGAAVLNLEALAADPRLLVDQQR